MNNLLKTLKSKRTIYIPSMWLGILVVGFLFPQHSMGFLFGTIWGVLWMLAYDWWIKK